MCQHQTMLAIASLLAAVCLSTLAPTRAPMRPNSAAPIPEKSNRDKSGTTTTPKNDQGPQTPCSQAVAGLGSFVTEREGFSESSLLLPRPVANVP